MRSDMCGGHLTRYARSPARAFLPAALLLAFSACQPADRRPGGAEAPINVAVFEGNGASPLCVVETVEALRIDPAIRPVTIGASRILTDSLADVDVLVFPGGSGSRELNNLGSGLRDLVRDFVIERGGGIVGICAGAYLVSDTDGYPCLNIVSAHAIDRDHDERGSAVARVLFTPEGLGLFPEMEGLEAGYIQYHDGPLFIPARSAASGGYTEHASFASDIHCSPGAPAGMTPGKPFLLSQEVGEGLVFACAGHPESTRGMRWIVPRMARLAARREPVAYGGNVVRPGLGDREIMHDDAVENDLFWRLFDEDPAERIEALGRLMELRHRNGVRWAVGMTRDESPDVRRCAARVLADFEYTAAIPDLEALLRVETDEGCRATVAECLERLRAMRGG